MNLNYALFSSSNIYDYELSFEPDLDEGFDLVKNGIFGRLNDMEISPLWDEFGVVVEEINEDFVILSDSFQRGCFNTASLWKILCVDTVHGDLWLDLDPDSVWYFWDWVKPAKCSI